MMRMRSLKKVRLIGAIAGCIFFFSSSTGWSASTDLAGSPAAASKNTQVFGGNAASSQNQAGRGAFSGSSTFRRGGFSPLSPENNPNGTDGFGLSDESGFSPLGSSAPRTASPVDRAHQATAVRKAPSNRDGFAPSSGGGSTNMQGPETSSSGGAAPLAGDSKLPHKEPKKLPLQNRGGAAGTHEPAPASGRSVQVQSGSTSHSRAPLRVRASAPAPYKNTNNSGSEPVNPAGYSEPGSKGTVGERTLHGVGGPDGKLVVGEGMHPSMGSGDTVTVRDAESGVSANFGVTSSSQVVSGSKGTHIDKTMDGVNGGSLTVGEGMYGARDSGGSATVIDSRSGAKATFGAENIQNNVQGGSKGSEAERTLHGVGAGPGGKLTVGEGMYPSMGPDGTVTVRDGESGTSVNFGVTSSTYEKGGKKTAGDSPTGGKRSSSSGGKPSGGKHTSGGKPSGGKQGSSSDDKKTGKQGSSSDDKKTGKDDSSSGDKKPDSKDGDKPDKKQGNDKLVGEGGSGVAGGDSAQDIYNKLHKPGNADKPSNGGRARGDVSQPGPGSSGGSSTGSQAGGHISAGGSAVGVVTGDQGSSKSPLNMVDPGRFGSRQLTPSNGAGDQLLHRRDSVNPGGG